MLKIHEKIMRTDFAKMLKRLVIVMVCVTVFGGGISAGLLAPQVREAAADARRWEQDKENRYRNGDGDSGEWDNEEYEFFDHMTVTRPSTAALTAAGITGLTGSVLLFLIWLSVAAWLYQAAVRSGMNGLLWFTAGLAGNVFAAILFLIVRSFIRVKCPSCGGYQPIKIQYCVKCGAALYETCAGCGASCDAKDAFCKACGRELHREGL